MQGLADRNRIPDQDLAERLDQESWQDLGAKPHIFRIFKLEDVILLRKRGILFLKQDVGWIYSRICIKIWANLVRISGSRFG